MSSEVQCDQKTRDILGDGGIAEVVGNLWARDCQTCGRPLGTVTPALCVDDASTYATASLHHQGCRPATWNDDPVIYAAAGANLSWTSLSFMLPSVTARKAATEPVAASSTVAASKATAVATAAVAASLRKSCTAQQKGRSANRRAQKMRMLHRSLLQFGSVTLVANQMLPPPIKNRVIQEAKSSGGGRFLREFWQSA